MIIIFSVRLVSNQVQSETSGSNRESGNGGRGERDPEPRKNLRSGRHRAVLHEDLVGTGVLAAPVHDALPRAPPYGSQGVEGRDFAAKEASAQ